MSKSSAHRSNICIHCASTYAKGVLKISQKRDYYVGLLLFIGREQNRKVLANQVWVTSWIFPPSMTGRVKEFVSSFYHTKIKQALKPSKPFNDFQFIFMTQCNVTEAFPRSVTTLPYSKTSWKVLLTKG